MAQEDDGAVYITFKFCRTDFFCQRAELPFSLCLLCFVLSRPPTHCFCFREMGYFKDSCSPLNIFQLGKPLLLGVAYSLVGECNGTAGTPSESHIFELSVGECTPRNLTSMKLLDNK